jgi:hypothetical protein
MFRATILFGCLSTLLLTVWYGAEVRAQTQKDSRTRVTLEDVEVIVSDEELRSSIDNIVFVRGTVSYDDTFKNPISILTTKFGKSYSCRGVEKYKGHDVLVAAVPQFEVPADASVGGVQTDRRAVNLVYARVVGVAGTRKK